MLGIAPGAVRLPLGPSPGPAGHPPLGEGFFTQSPKRSNTSTMANYREEHIRNNRRLARQVVGAAALLLALIGLFTVLGWIVGLVRAALDDTDLRNEYRDRLYGMGMLDPVAFDDVNSVDEGIFKQAAIWGTVYQVQNSGGSLDQYERDPDTGRTSMVPTGEEFTYDCQLAFIAAGFTGCESYVADAFGVELTARGNVADYSFKTNVEKVFVCGDMRRGQSLVVGGLREGRDCAAEVDRCLMGYTNL